MNSRRFEKKVCLVSGGGSGIGRATCERFAAEGGRVVVIDVNEEHGQATVRSILDAGGEASSLKLMSQILIKFRPPLIPLSISGERFM